MWWHNSEWVRLSIETYHCQCDTLSKWDNHWTINPHCPSWTWFGQWNRKKNMKESPTLLNKITQQLKKKWKMENGKKKASKHFEEGFFFLSCWVILFSFSGLLSCFFHVFFFFLFFIVQTMSNLDNEDWLSNECPIQTVYNAGSGWFSNQWPHY